MSYWLVHGHTTAMMTHLFPVDVPEILRHQTRWVCVKCSGPGYGLMVYARVEKYDKYCRSPSAVLDIGSTVICSPRILPLNPGM